MLGSIQSEISWITPFSCCFVSPFFSCEQSTEFKYTYLELPAQELWCCGCWWWCFLLFCSGDLEASLALSCGGHIPYLAINQRHETLLSISLPLPYFSLTSFSWFSSASNSFFDLLILRWISIFCCWDNTPGIRGCIYKVTVNYCW